MSEKILKQGALGTTNRGATQLIQVILSFVSGENETLCRHVHAGCQSCVTECERWVDKRDTSLLESFSSRELFSPALDTALFWQEHILSYVSRFVFKDRMSQFPLFFSVCHASTGEEMGRVVFQRLKRMRAPFENSVLSPPMVPITWSARGMAWFVTWPTWSDARLADQTMFSRTSGVYLIV